MSAVAPKKPRVKPPAPSATCKGCGAVGVTLIRTTAHLFPHYDERVSPRVLCRDDSDYSAEVAAWTRSQARGRA